MLRKTATSLEQIRRPTQLVENNLVHALRNMLVVHRLRFAVGVLPPGEPDPPVGDHVESEKSIGTNQEEPEHDDQFRLILFLWKAAEIMADHNFWQLQQLKSCLTKNYRES